MLNEFKQFALKGNVIDMAVGIIIGGAFGKIVSSFVNDVIMPGVGMLMGRVDFSNWALTLQEKTDTTPAVVIRYGLFLNNTLDFVIVAFAIFIAIKQMNRLRAEPPAPEVTEKLCPYCRSMVPIAATKCKFCASAL